MPLIEIWELPYHSWNNLALAKIFALLYHLLTDFDKEQNMSIYFFKIIRCFVGVALFNEELQSKIFAFGSFQ